MGHPTLGQNSTVPYQYEPLRNVPQDIRLVHLLPGRFDDPIRISIVHSPFPPMPTSRPKTNEFQTDSLRSLVTRPWTVEETDDGELVIFNIATGETVPITTTQSPLELPQSEYQPRYEALSYVWGLEDASELAQVGTKDPHSRPSTLVVRPNLAFALRYLRYPIETRVLWIDAICINQQDIAERNEQVKRMTSIYAFSQRVIAWVGTASHDSHHALTTFRFIGQQLRALKSGRVIASPNAEEPRLWRIDHRPPFGSRTWQALSEFLERTWFYRLWCWQEIKLGRQHALLQCGDDIIPWNKFWLAIVCLYEKDNLPSMKFGERCRHIAFLGHGAAEQPMSSLLDISRSKGCSDPRDKIYGLLGMMPEFFRSSIVVDYSLPVEAVYKDAFLAHVNATKRLELLKHCNYSNRSIAGPTWVPDWSKTEFRAPILTEQLSTGISRAWFSYLQPDILEVVGLLYSPVASVSHAASEVEGETLLAVKGWMQQLPSERTYITGDSMESAFAHTICMNRTRDRFPYNAFGSSAEWIEAVRKMVALTADSQGDHIYSLKETSNTIQKVRGRRFFTTEDGHIGTAPSSIQKEDIVCLLLGAYAPIVLRQTSLGSFKVIGECYVHGLEDAIGLLGPLEPPWKGVIKGDADGRLSQGFLNLATGEEMVDDPRLGPSHPVWERAAYKRRDDDPAIFQRFKNLETGEVINYDPRMSPESLQARGIKLEKIRLI
ncbi:Fc.00g071520.m01.CDS01 [Cosmosporella sp. VM-42]